MTADALTDPGAGTRRRRSPLYGLVGGYFISELGTAMAVVAIPWLVLITTGSAASTGVIGFAQMAPYVLLQAIGGPVADRVGRRRTFILGNATAAIPMCSIALLHADGGLSLGVLAAAVAVAGGARGLADAATTPMIPALAALGRVPAERAAGMYSAASRSAMLIGMPLAGALIAVTSASSVVLIDGASFAAAVAAIAVFVPATAVAAQHPGGRLSMRSYRTELGEGLRFLCADRLLLAIVAMVAGTNLLDEALISVLLPVWVRDRLHHATALGVVGGALGVGLLLGVVAGAWLGPRLPRRTTYAVGGLIAGSPPFFGLAAFAALPPVVSVALVSGIAGGVLNPIIGAVQFERIPSRLQARVLGAAKASAWLGIPFGSLLGGLLTDTIGLRAALLTCGCLMLAATTAPFIFRAWRGLDRRCVAAPLSTCALG